MRVLFMGTPDFAVPSLNALCDTHEVCAVITQPDRPVGRGMKLTPPEVKVAALEKNIPVYQPTKLKDEALMPLLKELAPDIIVVVAYGRILPKYILDFPKYGCINVHGSLLPKYRGAAPIQRAVLDGEKITGVCTMYMSEGLDCGDVIERAECEIGDTETAEALFDRLSVQGATLLLSTLLKIKKGEATRTPQDDSSATYAAMISRADGEINWEESAQATLNRIRGCYSWPIATANCDDAKIKIISATRGEKCSATPGTVMSVDVRGMQVACGDGTSIFITILQFPNAKRMSPDEYFRGHPSILGKVLR